MRKGYRKYRCEECKAEELHHWIERNRAARMRCTACGSARLELVTEAAKADQRSLNSVAVSGALHMTDPMWKHQSRHRKVVEG